MIGQPRPRLRRARRAPTLSVLLLAVAALAAAGCGLPTDRTARPVATEGSTVAPVPAEPTSTGVVRIYLLRADRLVPVDRAGSSADDALALLTAGPTPLDGATGLATALPPGAVTGVTRTAPGEMTVDLSPEFGALSGRDQQLAAAQLVWTATDLCCDNRVRVLLAGRPVPVPTDSGVVDRPVERADYRSLAPE